MSNLLHGRIFCEDCELPMVQIGQAYVCTGEYLLEHLGGTYISDIILEPTLSLVFANGCLLPLVCPCCGGAIHAIPGYEDEILDRVTHLVLTGVGWNDGNQELLLEFGVSAEDRETISVIGIHLDAVPGLLFPGKRTG